MSDYRTLQDFRERAGYDIDGMWYPRITSIVGIKAKQGLYRYYAGQSSWKASQEALERSAAEGTLVHETVEALMEGKDVPINPVIAPAIEAFLEFRRNHDIKPILIESRVLSRKHGYAGTVDVLAELDGVVGVLDIKTSKGIYRDYGLQTAAYVQALAESEDTPPPRTSWILRLDQANECGNCSATMRHKGGNTRVTGGSWKCRHNWSPVRGQFELQEMDGFADNLKAFLAAKELWEWEHRDWLGQLR